MAGFNYFTRKQANIIYAAIKRGEIKMVKRDVNRMYNLVGVRGFNLSVEDCEFLSKLNNVITAIFDSRLDVANGLLNGEMWRKEQVATDKVIDEWLNLFTDELVPIYETVEMWVKVED